jgi:hypothetical protein
MTKPRQQKQMEDNLMSKRILTRNILLVFFVCSVLIVVSDATSAPSHDTIYKINYDVGYKAGMGGGKDDKANAHSYSPETILANPLIQSFIRTISDQAVEHFGEAYRPDAERGYKDGFLAGYKDGFN